MARARKLPSGRARASNEVRRELEPIQRQAAVASDILAGRTYRDIAAALQVSLGTVAGDTRAMLNEWRTHYVEDIDEWAHVQLRRYDLLLNAYWDKALSGADEKAAELVLKIMDKQSQLLGLNTGEAVASFSLVLKWPEERDAGDSSAEAFGH